LAQTGGKRPCAFQGGFKLDNLSDKFDTGDLMEGAKILDKYYIPARYPNGFDTGAPVDYFTEKEAKEAIDYADKIIRFCKDNIA